LFPKKHEKSKIRSVRVSQILDNFLRENFTNNEKIPLTANDFILSLIENSKEYKEYLQKQRDEKNQSKLF